MIAWSRIGMLVAVAVLGMAALACGGDGGGDRSDGTHAWVAGNKVKCSETASRRVSGLWESNLEVAERLRFSSDSRGVSRLLKARRLCSEAR